MKRLRSAGQILTPDQLHNLQTGAGGSDTKPEQHLSRIGVAAQFLTGDDKRMLGNLYTATIDKHGPDSRQAKKIDTLARTIAALRATTATDQTDPWGLHSEHCRRRLTTRPQESRWSRRATLRDQRLISDADVLSA